MGMLRSVFNSRSAPIRLAFDEEYEVWSSHYVSPSSSQSFPSNDISTNTLVISPSLFSNLIGFIWSNRLQKNRSLTEVRAAPIVIRIPIIMLLTGPHIFTPCCTERNLRTKLYCKLLARNAKNKCIIGNIFCLATYFTFTTLWRILKIFGPDSQNCWAALISVRAEYL
jgi:hypothetical protein